MRTLVALALANVLIFLQGADKHGDGSRWMLRITPQAVQPQQAARPSLLEVLARHTQLAASRKHSASDLSDAAEAEDDGHKQ